MDTNTAIILVVALLALVAIGFFAVFRRRGKLKMQGPFNTSLEMQGSNESGSQPTGVKGEDLISEEGGLNAHDKTGQGVDIKRAHTKKDINLITESGSHPPKH